MNILFVCHRFPYPPSRGGKIRPFNMIRHLSQKHTVTVCSLAHTAEELQEGVKLKDYCAEVIAEILPPSSRWAQAVRALPTHRQSSVAYFWSSRLRSRIEQRWERSRFDVTLVHCAFAAPYVLGLTGGFRIMDFGDLDSGKWKDYCEHRSWPISWGYKWEATKLRRFEKEIAQRFDHCTFTTPGELQEFESLGVNRPCSVIPNGVDFDYFSRSQPLQADSDLIIFLGRMDYFPNVHGILEFTHDILPRIQNVVPDAKLLIVGSNPTRKVRELARMPGVSVTGKVADVRPFLQDAAVAIAPLRIARGTQNKILECMAMGVPVVATRQAAQGIQAVPGRDLLVADDNEAFAQCVVQLLKNPDLRKGLSEAGRQRVQMSHAWQFSMNLLDGLLESVPPAGNSQPQVLADGRTSVPSASPPRDRA